jgi:excisionase family DNA binding protein
MCDSCRYSKRAMPDPLLYDHAGAAEVLSTSERRVHKLRRAGKLAAVQDGRTLKFTLDELRRYAESLPSYEPKSAVAREAST